MDERKLAIILMHYGPDKQRLQTIEELSELEAEKDKRAQYCQ